MATRVPRCGSTASKRSSGGAALFALDAVIPITKHLRSTGNLQRTDEAEAKEFEEKPVLTMGARSAIVNTLTTQTTESLGTPEGKEELRMLLKEHVSEALKVEIVDVLLSDFVVQY